VKSSPRWPRIVAEALRDVLPPTGLANRNVRHATSTQVAEAMARAMRPSRAPDNAPGWLRPEQVDCWRRALAALTRFGGALVAEPVGFGKTWIALAIADARRETPMVLAPAIVHAQWHRAATRAGVTINLHSHERLSRGTLPRTDARLVIIDEAHRFRTGNTKRVHTVAPWLLGRRVVLLSATPIVNGADDLPALLDLIVSDDSLTLDGVRSLRGLGAMSQPPPALRHLVICSRTTQRGVGIREVILHPAPREQARAMSAVSAVARLALSHRTEIGRLIRSTLFDAAGSSDAALADALRRYQVLLTHARDSGGATRAVLRKFAGPLLDQFTMWAMLGPSDLAADLPLGDLTTLDEILDTFAPDDVAWTDALQRVTADGVVTVCFVRHRATAVTLRYALRSVVAWINGESAGIGQHRVSRAVVLEAFGPERAGWNAFRTPPTVLVATDVAAEGLDLQGAGRVVHVDLPWTAMRLRQREGRLLRPGQCHAEVEIVVRQPPRAIEAVLAPRARVDRKATVTERWMSALSRPDPPVATCSPATAPIAIVGTRAPDAALLILALERPDSSGVQILILRDGEWSSASDEAEAMLHRAAASPCSGMPRTEFNALILDGMTASVRLSAETASSCPALLVRLQFMARRAARRRDTRTLRTLDRLLRFAAAPVSRGGRLLLTELLGADDAELLNAVVPDRPVAIPPGVRLVAAVVFRSDSGALR